MSSFFCHFTEWSLLDYKAFHGIHLKGLSAGTGKLCIFGHLGLVFIWSCFVSCLLLLLYYVICAPVLTEGTHLKDTNVLQFLATDSYKNIVGTLPPNAVFCFLLLACLLVFPMVFLAVNSPNLVHHYWECKTTAKCPNTGFDWDCSSCIHITFWGEPAYLCCSVKMFSRRQQLVVDQELSTSHWLV